MNDTPCVRIAVSAFIAIVLSAWTSASTVNADEDDLRQRLQQIRWEAETIDSIRSVYSKAASEVGPQAILYQVQRSSNSSSLGFEKSDATALNILQLQITTLSNWKFDGSAQPLTFVGQSQPTTTFEAIEQRRARQEHFYQKHRRSAFSPPLPTLWQQPYSLNRTDDEVLQIWNRRNDAFPRAIRSQITNCAVDSGIVAPEALFADAIWFGVSPAHGPLVPVHSDNLRVLSTMNTPESQPLNVEETLPSETGFSRRRLLLERSSLQILRAVWYPVDRTPAQLVRQPSEYAAQGQAAILDVPGERPPMMVVNLAYDSQKIGVPPTDVHVSWLNHFGGVQDFQHLRRVEPRSKNSVTNNDFPDGFWLIDTLTGSQYLTLHERTAEITQSTLQSANSYDDLLPKTATARLAVFLRQLVGKHPWAIVGGTWCLAILIWALWRRRKRSQMPIAPTVEPSTQGKTSGQD